MTNMSYVSGTGSVKLIGDTIGQHFDRTVARWPDRPALIDRGQNGASSGRRSMRLPPVWWHWA
jgi:hypothetical protein